MKKLRVGFIGCGRISGIYLQNLTGQFSRCIEVVACADLVREAAEARALEYGIDTVCSPDELLANPDVDLVLNLTVPAAHYDVTLAALEAGKHVYTEKPLAVTTQEGRHLLDVAAARGLRLGGAPDTFLGAGLQTCRKLIDDGWVGTPITATAIIAMGVNSHRYHTRGIGPMYDMGPYFVTALVTLLGPVVRATGATRIPFATKSNPDIEAPDYGVPFEVETPTIVAGVLNHESGVISTVTTTCEIFGYHPRLEIWGTEGILVCNDPNMFSKPITLRRRTGEALTMPFTHQYEQNSRGLGVADMAYALRDDRPHRASAELIYHALDIEEAFHIASDTGQHVTLHSRVDRPAPFASGLLTNVFE